MRVLISGFEPFGGRAINNAWEIAKRFEPCDGIDVCKVPVSFKNAHKVVIETMGRKKYDLVIMMGETPFTTDYVRLERLAINYMDSEKPDNDGYVADDEALVENAPKAYFTSLPVKKYTGHLKDLGYKVKTTNSTGTFVCNSLYYNVLRHLEESGSDTAALFLHLPVTTDMVSMEEMETIINAILSYFVKSAGFNTHAVIPTKAHRG